MRVPDRAYLRRFGAFYGRCLRLAFHGAWGVSGVIGTAASLLIPLLGRMFPALPLATMSDFVWQIPLYTLSGLFVLRLMAAPFWIHDSERPLPADAALNAWSVLVRVEYLDLVSRNFAVLHIVNRSRSDSLALTFALGVEYEDGTSEVWQHRVFKKFHLPLRLSLKPMEQTHGEVAFRPPLTNPAPVDPEQPHVRPKVKAAAMSMADHVTGRRFDVFATGEFEWGAGGDRRAHARALLALAEEGVHKYVNAKPPLPAFETLLRRAFRNWQARVLRAMDAAGCSESDMSDFRVLGTYTPRRIGGIDSLFGAQLREEAAERVDRLRRIARKVEEGSS